MREITLDTRTSTSRGVRAALDSFARAHRSGDADVRHRQFSFTTFHRAVRVTCGLPLLSACANDESHDLRAPDYQGIVHEVRIDEGIGMIARPNGSESVSIKLPPTGIEIQVREIVVAVGPRAIDLGDSVWVWFDSAERLAGASRFN